MFSTETSAPKRTRPQGKGPSGRMYIHPIPNSTSFSPYSPSPTIFSPATMLMTSLFPLPTQTLFRWLRLFLPTHKILRGGKMSGVWPFLFQSPPSLCSPFNVRNLSTHHQVTLNSSILPLETTPFILGVTFDPHFKFNAPIKSFINRPLPRINILITEVHYWYQLGLAKGNHNYHLYQNKVCSLFGPFSCMQLPFGFTLPHHPLLRNWKPFPLHSHRLR